MTVVDVIVIVVIILSALFSLMRGFVKEAISLATWIIAIWLAADPRADNVTADAPTSSQYHPG